MQNPANSTRRAEVKKSSTDILLPPAHKNQSPQHFQEWRDSGVDEQIIRLNVRSLDGDEPYDYLLYSDKISRRNDGRLRDGDLRKYCHIEHGGWWCSGADPLDEYKPMLWGCFKPNRPRRDKEGKKAIKYEHPYKEPTRAFLLFVPDYIWEKIAERYNIAITDKDKQHSFWHWVWRHNIPIVLCEGAKKAGALLSAGYAAIALPGINSGYRTKDALGNPIKPYLIADIARFAIGGRKFILAFDQDEKAETRQRVNAALSRFGGLLTAAGSEVAIASWDGRDGKGVDDLIVNRSEAAWEKAYQEAMPLAHWKILQNLLKQLTHPADIRLTTADLSTLQLQNLPEEGILAIASAKATGKTKFIAQATQETKSCLAAGHRIALMRNLSSRLKLDYRGDLDKYKGNFINRAGYSLRVGFCVDALLAINPAKFAGCDLVIDEVVQVVRHLLTSSTCGKEGKRPALLARFTELIKVARRVIIADADLDNATLHYIKELRGDNSPMFLIRNDYQPQGYQGKFIYAPDKSAIVSELITDAKSLPTVCCDRQHKS
jgi:hypothetical protein